ncbi:MAG: DUF1801 domain-containing protein [Labilithrix sp.]|nr:DUF1801 domain-containing protein [Labilithrix sp.]MCW5812683.1 DUF1801 domain-containing protein [Labilithrix sp.]
MSAEIRAYNQALGAEREEIANHLARLIDSRLPDAERKIWHAHPVWFLDGNPIVGYSKLKDCIRLMFWSGASFEEEHLRLGTGKFKDASIRYTSAEQIDERDVRRWLKKARSTQWDYKGLRKRGRLVRLA